MTDREAGILKVAREIILASYDCNDETRTVEVTEEVLKAWARRLNESANEWYATLRTTCEEAHEKLGWPTT